MNMLFVCKLVTCYIFVGINAFGRILQLKCMLACKLAKVHVLSQNQQRLPFIALIFKGRIFVYFVS